MIGANPASVEVVITFHTTHDALRVERRLRQEPWSVTLIPTPREISSECGFAVRVGTERGQELRDYLATHHLRWEAVYRETREKGANSYARDD